MEPQTTEVIIANWLKGSSKRRSNYTGEVYVTRMERVRADRPYKRPPGQGRKNGEA
jgi:hypothetical protein